MSLAVGKTERRQANEKGYTVGGTEATTKEGLFPGVNLESWEERISKEFRALLAFSQAAIVYI